MSIESIFLMGRFNWKILEKDKTAFIALGVVTLKFLFIGGSHRMTGLKIIYITGGIENGRNY